MEQGENEAYVSEMEKKEVARKYKEEEERKSKKQSSIFIGIVLISIIIFKFIILNGIIPSESMDPTVAPGDMIIVNRLAYRNKGPERLDVVVFGNNDSYVIKRVIGLPGDKVEIKKGKVYINDNPIEEPYVKEGGTTYISPRELEKEYIYEVPEKSLFLLGDNREHSFDSRYWDSPFISYDDLIGEFIFKYRLPILSSSFDE